MIGSRSCDQCARKYKYTVLHELAKLDDYDSVYFLLSAGADPNIYDDEGRTALMLAARTGNYRIVRRMLKYGADPSL